MIDSVLRVGVCLYEILFSEEIVLWLFANIHKANVPERLIELAPFAIVVVINRIVVRGRDEPAFSLGVFCRDVGIHRFEAEVGADFGRDFIAEKIKLPVGEFAAFPEVYRHLFLSLDLLHLRHRLNLGSRRVSLKKMRCVFPGNPVYRRRIVQPLFPHYELNGRVGFGVVSSLILDEPDAIFPEHRAGRALVVLPNPEVAPAPRKARSALRIISRDDSLSALRRLKNLFLAYHYVYCFKVIFQLKWRHPPRNVPVCNRTGTALFLHNRSIPDAYVRRV